MLLNLYLFTSVQSKAFVLPFCIYEPLAHEAIFFFFLNITMYRAFPSHRKELCTVDCCLFFPPVITTLVCVVLSAVLVQVKKFYTRNQKSGETWEHRTRLKDRKNFNIEYTKHFKICTESIQFLQGDGLGAPPRVWVGDAGLLLRFRESGAGWPRGSFISVSCLLLTGLRCPSACGREAAPWSLPTEA